MSPTADPDYDIVLVGASGFVGRLTALHLARHAPAGLRIGLAGRSVVRLAKARSQLGARAGDWPLIRVDVTDPSQVAALAARTRVVATTVGPYLRYGLALAQACAEAGTHYADLTGETLFVRRSIDAGQAAAQASGAQIVHACGFDAIPSDLGVGLLAARVAADGAGRLAETVLHVRDINGGVSGGSIDSLRGQLVESAGRPDLRATMADPLALVDGESRTALAPAPRRRGRLGLRQDLGTGMWSAPFLMGGFNRQIVLRSDALTGGSYGPEFGYREAVDTSSGPLGAVSAAAVALGSGALIGGLAFGPTRWLLGRVLPKPGEGPSEKARREGRFEIEIDAATTSGARYRCRIAAPYDPGYGGTAVMLGESVLCLALDADRPSTAGVLTPMTAMGEALAVRLRDHRFTLAVEQILS